MGILEETSPLHDDRLFAFHAMECINHSLPIIKMQLAPLYKRFIQNWSFPNLDTLSLDHRTKINWFQTGSLLLLERVFILPLSAVIEEPDGHDDKYDHNAKCYK